jgi:hypothetical protein
MGKTAVTKVTDFPRRKYRGRRVGQLATDEADRCPACGG